MGRKNPKSWVRSLFALDAVSIKSLGGGAGSSVGAPLAVRVTTGPTTNAPCVAVVLVVAHEPRPAS